ncbi:zf-HC2 domain-containing protein [Streptomyces atroolivaceus]|uniref:zf-HC2 domain-containing protein n=1 Tax=Streptomyces atroolivaceus TaxID=66869 RepID=UPI002025169B|nr:zf-HC2 domain-containing protein [Streptomyces atroolivaceus]
MCANEPRRDAGAYALGVLGAADACRFEQHLTKCSACVDQVRRFGVVVHHLAACAHRPPPSSPPRAP